MISFYIQYLDILIIVCFCLFSGNLQRSTLVKHNSCKDHKDSVEADKLRRQLYDVEETSSKESSCPIPVKESELHLFRATYFVAKELRPNSAVNSELRFLKLCGIKDCMSDLHSNSIKDVQNSLLYVIQQNLKTEVKDSEYYGIIIDESTDLSIHKKLVVYLRYIHNGEMKTELIGNIRIKDGKAQTIHEELQISLGTLGLNVKNCVGLGSDGASVMFGRKGGVGVLLGKDAPLLTHVHCVAHRLSLACSDAAKDIPFLKSYKDTLKNLYIHVSGSGIRVSKLEALQSIMEEPQLKLKDPISVRWLAMENAVSTIHKCYGSIVSYLQSNDGKNTVGDVIADGLLKEVLHYKFPAFTAVLSDILCVIGQLSKQLQAENLDLTEILPQKDSALGRLNGLKEIKGQCESEFYSQISSNGSKMYYKGIPLTHANEKSQIEKLKISYIDSVSQKVDSRIASDPVLEAFSVLEPQSFESLTEEERISYLNQLSEKYDSDIDTLKREYSGLKYLMKGSYRNIKFQSFCHRILTRHTEDYPEISRLCKIAMCIPVSSVACERGFSLQNKIKVKARTSLTPEALDMLMKLATGPEIETFPYELAVRHWNKEKKRRLARLYQPKKPTEDSPIVL